MTSHIPAKMQRDRAICAALERPILLPELAAIVAGYDRNPSQTWCQDPTWVPMGVKISSDGKSFQIVDATAGGVTATNTVGVRGSNDFGTGACKWSVNVPEGIHFYAGVIDISKTPRAPLLDHRNDCTAFVSISNYGIIGRPHTEIPGARALDILYPIYNAKCLTIRFEAEVDAGTLSCTVNGQTAKIFEGLDLRRCAPYCAVVRHAVSSCAPITIHSQPE